MTLKNDNIHPYQIILYHYIGMQVIFAMCIISLIGYTFMNLYLLLTEESINNIDISWFYNCISLCVVILLQFFGCCNIFNEKYKYFKLLFGLTNFILVIFGIFIICQKDLINNIMILSIFSIVLQTITGILFTINSLLLIES